MELTEENIEYIRQGIREKGITMQALTDSLVDHICCIIENEPGTDFQAAYDRAFAAFGKNELKEIQQQTILLLILKKEAAMKKTMYLLGYVAVVLSTTGLLFKFQHWPGASITLILGILLLNFGFLPMYFYDKYKQATG
jgi:hypothetical protein